MGGGESPLEQCGFVCSFIVFPLGSIYVLWLVVPNDADDSWEMASLHGPANALANFSTSLVCLFVAVPLLYGMANRSISPRVDSIHNLVDDLTREASTISSNLKLEKEHVPEICDCPVTEVNRIMDERLG